MKMMKTTNADNSVAYAAPLIPRLKLKMKIGSKIIFRMFDAIIRMVGVVEFPSACNVSEKTLTKMKMYAKIAIGTR
jgi:hypothetical protein